MQKSKMNLWALVFILECVLGIPQVAATLDGGGNINVEFDKNESRGADKIGGRSGSGPGIDDAWGDAGLTREFLAHATDEEIDELMGEFLDPDLPLEDAIANFLTTLAELMDAKIEEQSEKIEKLRSGEDSNSPQKSDTDVEMMELKRLSERRSQLFDTFRQVSEKYSESTEKSVQGLGR